MPSFHQLLHDARWRPHWRLLLLVFAAISAYFAFSPATPQVAVSLQDKVSHLAAFSAMGLAAALGQPASWRHASIAAAGLVAYGGFIELVQSTLPTRTADFADLMADALGAAAGLLLAAALRRLWRRQALI